MWQNISTTATERRVYKMDFQKSCSFQEMKKKLFVNSRVKFPRYFLYHILFFLSFLKRKWPNKDITHAIYFSADIVSTILRSVNNRHLTSTVSTPVNWAGISNLLIFLFFEVQHGIYPALAASKWLRSSFNYCSQMLEHTHGLFPDTIQNTSDCE